MVRIVSLTLLLLTCLGSLGLADKVRLGSLNQCDARLKTRGLFPSARHSKSLLCGPTCLVNALNNFVPPGSFNKMEEVEYIVEEVGPTFGVPAEETRKKGMAPFELQYFARLFFQKWIPGVEVFSKGPKAHRDYVRTRGVRHPGFSSSPHILHSDLITASISELVILNYQRWPRTTKLDDLDPRTKPKYGGHFVILEEIESHYADGSIDVVLRDPFFGRITGTLYPVLLGEGIRSFRLIRPDRYRQRKAILTALTRISLLP